MTVKVARADDGFMVSYDVYGKRDGEPLLLIQGLGADSRVGRCSGCRWGAGSGAMRSTTVASAAARGRRTRSRSSRWRTTRLPCSTPKAWSVRT